MGGINVVFYVALKTMKLMTNYNGIREELKGWIYNNKQRLKCTPDVTVFFVFFTRLFKTPVTSNIVLGKWSCGYQNFPKPIL